MPLTIAISTEPIAWKTPLMHDTTAPIVAVWLWWGEATARGGLLMGDVIELCKMLFYRR